MLLRLLQTYTRIENLVSLKHVRPPIRVHLPLPSSDCMVKHEHFGPRLSRARDLFSYQRFDLWQILVADGRNVFPVTSVFQSLLGIHETVLIKRWAFTLRQKLVPIQHPHRDLHWLP